MSVEGWIVMTLREAGVSLLDCEHKTPPAREIGYPYVAIPQIKMVELI
jgi:type I restriction enzyme, S subunit